MPWEFTATVFHNHSNYFKKDFYIENHECSLANVDKENNVSAAKGILFDYDEHIQTENNNNNGNYMRCHCGKLCDSQWIKST